MENAITIEETRSDLCICKLCRDIFRHVCRTNTRKCQFSITVHLLFLVNRHDKLYFVTVRRNVNDEIIDLQNIEIRKY